MPKKTPSKKTATPSAKKAPPKKVVKTTGKPAKMVSMPMKSKPSMYLSGKEADPFKDHPVGKMLKMNVMAKVTGQSEREGMHGKHHSCDLEIHKIGMTEKK